MKLRKPDKSVSNMDVLKDIRGLLSVTPKQEEVAAEGVKDESRLEAETARLEAQIKHYKELVQKQQEELRRVKSEKEELTAKLKALGSGKDKPVSPTSKSSAQNEEAVQLEARIAELSSTLSQVEDLLKLRNQELLKRIARLFQEAGQSDVAIEFRKGASELEDVENFAHFLEVLLGQ